MCLHCCRPSSILTKSESILQFGIHPLKPLRLAGSLGTPIESAPHFTAPSISLYQSPSFRKKSSRLSRAPAFRGIFLTVVALGPSPWSSLTGNCQLWNGHCLVPFSDPWLQHCSKMFISGEQKSNPTLGSIIFDSIHVRSIHLRFWIPNVGK